MVISIAVRWPFAGLLFGFIRNEGLEWRKDPARVKAYRLGTWVIIAVLVLRLVVQVPLYLMGEAGLAAPGHHPAHHGGAAVHPGRVGGLAADQAGPGARCPSPADP